MSGGRKRKPVWRLYREIPATTNPKRCKKAVCKFCGKELMAQVGRMQLSHSAISELDDTSAGLILMGWMWLKQEVRKSDFLTSADKATIIEKMKRRTKIFIEDHHLVGWLLDPRSRGCGVGSSGKRQVRELGKKLFYFLYPEKSDADVNHFVDQWIAYVSQTGIFNKESVIWLPCVVSKPFLFWCDVSGEAPELSQLAKSVLSCSPHTASRERLWSSAAATVTKSPVASKCCNDSPSQTPFHEEKSK